jgi:hypothetical protein
MPQIDLEVFCLSFQKYYCDQEVIEGWKDCKQEEEHQERLNRSSLMKLI